MSKPYRTKIIPYNKFSRPKVKLTGVEGAVVHWTANAGATAENHYNYFKNLNGRYASAHVFVYRNDAVLIIPEDEVTYHANDGGYSKVPAFRASNSNYNNGNANLTTLGVEMCLDADGSIHSQTVAKTKEVVEYWMKKYNFGKDKVVRHFDVTGKNCPAPWVSNPSYYNNFIKSLNSGGSGGSKSSGSSSAKTHKVKKGDTLYSLAKKYNTSVDKIKSINNMDSDLIRTGQTLKVGGSLTQIKVKANKLWYYGSANWNDKVAQVSKGEVFTVVDTHKIGGYNMYELKSGTFITASTKYVEVI